MPSNSYNQSLVRWILNTLQAETTIGSDVLEYARATFGTVDLSKIVTTADSTDIDSLLDLIFYPDLPIKTHFENKWGSISFSHADEAEIIARLSAAPIPCTIICAECAANINIHLPFWIPESFVQRLNITWQPDAQIRDALDRHLPRDRQIVTRIYLRDAGRLCQIRAARPHQAGLISAFIAKMPWDSIDYEPCLLFLLTILPEFPEGQPPYDFLVSQKGHYFQCLCKAEDFERRRQTTNMEILMLQGERAAHGSLDQWRRHMRRIDTICRALFGRTQFFSRPLEAYTAIRPGGDGWKPDHDGLVKNSE